MTLLRASTEAEYKRIHMAVIEYLDDNHNDPDLVLNDFCTANNYSRRSVQRALKSFNTSWSQMVIQFRVTTARGLIVHSDDDIEVISVKVGYLSSSYFSHLFKKMYGKEPREYRRLHRR